MASLWNESNKTAHEASQTAQFDLGKVEDVESNEGSDALVPHLAKVNVRGQDASHWMPVIVPVHGDVNVPIVNARVLVGYLRGNRPFAIPAYYGDEDVRPYDVGDRILGHPETDARMKIDNDGNITVVDANGNEVVTDDGNGDTIVKNNSGSTVKLKSNGDVIINNDGTLYLGSDTGTEPVARKGDSVEVDDPDSGTITGQITQGSTDVETE